MIRDQPNIEGCTELISSLDRLSAAAIGAQGFVAPQFDRLAKAAATADGPHRQLARLASELGLEHKEES